VLQIFHMVHILFLQCSPPLFTHKTEYQLLSPISISSIHIRVKRQNQTFFIPSSPNGSFAQIKEEISKAMGGDDVISPKLMRLYVVNKNDAGETDANESTTGPIPDAALLSDHKVENDDILFLSFLKNWEGGIDGDNVPEEDEKWEDVKKSS